MPQIDAKYIAKLAKKITASRAQFERLYDKMVVKGAQQPGRFKTLALFRDLKAPGLTGSKKDVADFTAALTSAAEAGWLESFIAQNFGQLLEGAPAADAAIALQAVVDFNETFREALDFKIGYADALRRCCRIRYPTDAGEAGGSGFLIGPHLVLTNWHVVRPLLDPQNDTPLPGSDANIRVEFDYVERPHKAGLSTPKVCSVAKQWLAAHSRAHLHELGFLEAANDKPWPDPPNDLDDFGDFAVIQLAEAVGYDRGFYDLAAAKMPPPDTAAVLVQFPQSWAMRVTPGQFREPFGSLPAFADPADPPRLLHTANSLEGSSGGLLFDFGFTHCGLHQAGLTFTAADGQHDDKGKLFKRATVNAAIPLTRVNAKVGGLVRDLTAAAPKLVTTSATGAPIIGRSQFQELVNQAISGDVRLIVVQNDPHPISRQPRRRVGKSYTKVILEALLPAAQHAVFVVDASTLNSDAYEAARAIVEQIRPAALSGLPAKSDLQTSIDASVPALVASVLGALQAEAGPRMLWLMIDGLDSSPVSSGSTTATFLNKLYRAADAIDAVRIVLVGPTTPLPGLVDLVRARVEGIRPLSNDDAVNWLGRRRGLEAGAEIDAIKVAVNMARKLAEKEAPADERDQTEAFVTALVNFAIDQFPATGGGG